MKSLSPLLLHFIKSNILFNFIIFLTIKGICLPATYRPHNPVIGNIENGNAQNHVNRTSVIACFPLNLPSIGQLIVL